MNTVTMVFEPGPECRLSDLKSGQLFKTQDSSQWLRRRLGSDLDQAPDCATEDLDGGEIGKVRLVFGGLTVNPGTLRFPYADEV